MRRIHLVSFRASSRRSLALPGLFALAATVPVSLLACGSSASSALPDDSGAISIVTETSVPDGSPTPDASPEAAPTPDASDAGHISDKYPAFPLNAPQLINQGGAILSNPKIVSVTWAGDPEASKLEDFTDKIGASAYWAAATSEYLVGSATTGPGSHIHDATALAATFSDTDADAYVKKNLSDPTSGWPKPTADSVYILYLPATVDLQVHQQGGVAGACASGIGGYHTNTQLADGTDVAYAVVPRCHFPGDTTLEMATSSASHELAEAATDALPQTSRAYSGFDNDHIAWTAFQLLQTENGDICEFYRDSFYVNADLGYKVQRLWSNASISAGHAPCVPTDGSPYFNAVPLGLGKVTFTVPAAAGGGGSFKASGVNIKVGATGTFQVGYYSDGPMDADWDLTAVEGNGIRGTSFGGGGGAAFDNGNLVISVDNTHGRNGNTATVTVKVNGTDSLLGANLVTLVSTSASKPGIAHYWPVLVTSK